MKRILILAAIVGLLSSACADAGSGSLGPVGDGPSPDQAGGAITTTAPPPTTPPPTPSPEPGQETMAFEVWFAAGEGPWLFVTRRTEPFDPGIGAASLRALLAGPTETERAAGVASAVPEGTELLGLSIDDGLATADLSAEFESGGGSTSMFVRLAQLTYTLTQFGSVDEVIFTLEGEPIGDSFSSEGIVVDHPMTRRDFDEYLPPILVESPIVGERVASPLTVTGTADVFEATVSISVLDARGVEIVRTFTTATCGTGCRGDFSETVRYRVDQTQPGVVRVYESSAETGEPIHVVDIPVTLVG